MPIEARKRLHVGPIYINGASCKRCGWFVRSKNRHDMATCKCSKLSVDGGSAYARRLGDPDHYDNVIVEFTHLTEDEQ